MIDSQLLQWLAFLRPQSVYRNEEDQLDKERVFFSKEYLMVSHDQTFFTLLL